MNRLAAVVCAALLGSFATADTITFDFEDLSGNPNRSAGDNAALLLVQGGFAALIKRTGGERFTVWDSTGEAAPVSWGRRHLSPTFNYFKDDYFVMSFSHPATSVSIEFGNFGQDLDTAEIHAYTGLDGTGNLLGSAYGYLGSSDISVDPPRRGWSSRRSTGRRSHPSSSAPGPLAALALAAGRRRASAERGSKAADRNG